MNHPQKQKKIKKVLDNVKKLCYKELTETEKRPNSVNPLGNIPKTSKSLRDYLTTKWCNSRFGERYERDSKNLSKFFMSPTLEKDNRCDS